MNYKVLVGEVILRAYQRALVWVSLISFFELANLELGWQRRGMSEVDCW